MLIIPNNALLDFLCQTHLDQRPQWEGGREGRASPACAAREEREVQQHFVGNHKQTKTAFIRTQATEPDSCLYMNVQPCAGTHAHTACTHTHTHKTNAKKSRTKTWRHSRKKWNTSSRRVNKSLHKTRHILWVLNCVKRKTVHWNPTENPNRTACTYLPPR